MTDFQINDQDIAGCKGKVAIVTGGSSGIGLATVDLLLSLGASVVSGDMQEAPVKNGVSHVPVDVRKWSDLTQLFKATMEKHGRVDYVFANAGIGPRADYLSLASDDQGELLEPNKDTLDVNFNSVINTVILAAHYMKTQIDGGSIVITASSTGLHPVRAVDYATAKAGIIGLGRNFARLVEVANLPIRVNTLAPSWTATQVLPDLSTLLSAVSQNYQSPHVVARAVAYLMASKTRHGHLIFVSGGKFKEIEKSLLTPAYESIKGDGLSDDAVLGKVLALGTSR
ncbi:hypothetical protein ACEQ8H_003903 [Pleosporales sp. CAS-2024a]